MDLIIRQLDAFSGSLAPLREAASRYLERPSVLANEGALNIGHRPWVAELNYMFMLYPGIDSDSIERYSQRFGIEIPGLYSKVLHEMNGAFCFGMSLCGIPRTMLGNVPILDRTILQCHDLATAATLWRGEYRVPASFFHFGGRAFSYSENVGYFIDKNQRILCVKKRGKVVAEWASFEEFLNDELRVSEKLEEELHPKR